MTIAATCERDTHLFEWIRCSIAILDTGEITQQFNVSEVSVKIVAKQKRMSLIKLFDVFHLRFCRLPKKNHQKCYIIEHVIRVNTMNGNGSSHQPKMNWLLLCLAIWAHGAVVAIEKQKVKKKHCTQTFMRDAHNVRLLPHRKSNNSHFRFWMV